MRRYARCAVVALALGAVACGGEQRREATRAAGGRDLAVSLRVGPTVVAPGASLHVLLGARNRADTAVTLRFATSQRYDFAVLDAAGNEVWRWSAGRTFVQATGEQTVPPGWEVNYEEDFAAPTAAGDYRLVGAVMALGGSPSGVASFTVR